MRIDSVKKVAAVALGLVVCSYFSANASSTEKRPFGVEPREMTGITMREGDALHDLHVAKLEELGKDCTVCHIDGNYESFMALDGQKTQDDKIAYLHENCTACHKEMSGPKITSCRSCHAEKFAAK